MIQVTLLRSVILRFVGLLVFFFTTVGLKDQFQCWENYVGQQMYVRLHFSRMTQLRLTSPTVSRLVGLGGVCTFGSGAWNIGILASTRCCPL